MKHHAGTDQQYLLPLPTQVGTVHCHYRWGHHLNLAVAFEAQTPRDVDMRPDGSLGPGWSVHSLPYGYDCT